MWVPSSVDRLLKSLKKLPGIGTRTAERLVFFLLRNKDVMQELASSLEIASKELQFCSICHGITDVDPCPICTDENRDNSVLALVERPQDVFLIEKLAIFNGRYHVLGGVLSPVDGIGPEDLNLDDLIHHIQSLGVKEVIIALNPTIEGDATAQFVADLLKNTDVKLTRIARGLPAGSDISLSDLTTLRDAILGRSEW